jgi:hypothetical protein
LFYCSFELLFGMFHVLLTEQNKYFMVLRYPLNICGKMSASSKTVNIFVVANKHEPFPC